MKSERKAFWIFFLWMLLLPFLDQLSLRAEDSKEPVAASAQDLEIADAQENASATEEESEAPKDSDDEAPAETAGQEKLPALSADPIELLGKVSGLAKAKKYKNVIRTLSSHEDVVKTDEELLKVYIEALINDAKPKWNTVNSFGKTLAQKDRNSSLANFAQALYYLNKKKPDSTKALQYLKKAKSAKNPYPGVSTKYYIIMLKKYWQIVLVLLVIPILVVSKIAKKKKAVSAVEVELNLDEEAKDDKEPSKSDEEAKVEANIDKVKAAEPIKVAKEIVPGSEKTDSVQAEIKEQIKKQVKEESKKNPKKKSKYILILSLNRTLHQCRLQIKNRLRRFLLILHHCKLSGIQLPIDKCQKKHL